MKQSAYPQLKKSLLSILPIHQSTAWKVLHISHQDMADLLEIMIRDNLVKRTPTSIDGHRTFFIESLIHKKKKAMNFNPLLSGKLFAPCPGCIDEECLPSHCGKLESWVVGKV